MKRSRKPLERLGFGPEKRGDPMEGFPSIRIEGMPYNLWLTERVLVPLLARWRSRAEELLAGTGAVGEDLDWAVRLCRESFRSVLPACVAAGDPALLAALAVTANLQRTAGCVGSLIVERRPHRLRRLTLSRYWCGLAEHPHALPLSPPLTHPPARPASIRPERRDCRHLANALWCPSGTIQDRCDQALARLRHEVRSQGIRVPRDLRPPQ